MNRRKRKILDEAAFGVKERVFPKAVNIFNYFVIIAVIGSLILQLPVLYKEKHCVSYIDALFTTVSALCVTGLCPIDMEVFNKAGLAFLMVIIELGGLGLIAFFTFYVLIPSRRLSLINRQIVKDFFVSDVETNHRSILKQIIFYSLLIQIAGGIFLSLILKQAGEKDFAFFGFFLSVSAFCNAGFAPWATSLRHLNTNILFNAVIIFLIIFGGLGFTVMQDVIFRWRSKLHRFIFGEGKVHVMSLHSKIVFLMTLILVLVPSGIYLLLEWNHAFRDLDVISKIVNAVFQSVTCRTAGFETVSEGSFTPAGTFISELLMAIGGNPGSMAGGIKTTTIFLLVCQSFRSTSDLGPLSIFQRDISYEDTDKATGVIIKAVIFIGCVIFALLLSESSSIASGKILAGDLTFEAISAIGTAGLTRGITGDLNILSKLILIVGMYGGRTGIITLTLSIPMKSQDIKRFVDYPKEEILVG